MGRTLTILLVIAVTIRGRAASGDLDPRLPALRPAPLSDYYATLRVLGAGDTLPGESESLRWAGARLALLTDQLPESLPLRTPATTVLIAHRKDPKYRETIDRLLWRRLDPALSSIASSAELPAAFDRIAAELRPLCGARADSIRESLRGLYISDYRSFMETTWPPRERLTGEWIRAATDAIHPHESKLLAELGRLLAVPIPDTSRVRILVISERMPPAAPTTVVRDGRARIVVSARSASGREAVLDLLCAYMLACDALAPETPPSVARLLTGSARDPGSLHLAQELHRSLLKYAVSMELSEIYGWGGFVALPSDASGAASFRKNWDAYVTGGISLSTACSAIASDASGGWK